MIGKIFGNADIGDSSKLIEEYLSTNETILLSFKFIRDELTLTNEGIYYVDVQGITGKKKQVEFYPAKSIDSITFETAGTLDFDSDLKIHTKGRSHPIIIKVSASNQEATKEIIKLMKEHYFN